MSYIGANQSAQGNRPLSAKKTSAVISTLDGISKGLSPAQALVLNKISWLHSISKTRYKGHIVAFATHAGLARLIANDGGPRYKPEGVRRAVERLAEYGLIATGCMRTFRKDETGQRVYGRASIFLPIRASLEGWTKPPPGKTRTGEGGRSAMKALIGLSETGHADTSETGHEDAFVETGHKVSFWKPATRSVCLYETDKEDTEKQDTDFVRASAHDLSVAPLTIEAPQGRISDDPPNEKSDKVTSLHRLWRSYCEENDRFAATTLSRVDAGCLKRFLTVCADADDSPRVVFKRVLKQWVHFTHMLETRFGAYRLPHTPMLWVVSKYAEQAVQFHHEEKQHAPIKAPSQPMHSTAPEKAAKPPNSVPAGVTQEEFDRLCEIEFQGAFGHLMHSNSGPYPDEKVRRDHWARAKMITDRGITRGHIVPRSDEPEVQVA